MGRITIKNAPLNITIKQQKELQDLGFKRANYLAPWVYKAQDTSDLVDIVEEMDFSKNLSSLQRKIKF